MLRAVCAAAATSLAMLVAGCGSESPAPPAGTTISYSSFGTTADIDCGNGKSLTVAGSNNTLTVTGACGSLSVDGADNTIRLARVDGQLSVPGLNNTITYKAGDPQVDDSGTGNRISRG